MTKNDQIENVTVVLSALFSGTNRLEAARTRTAHAARP